MSSGRLRKPNSADSARSFFDDDLGGDSLLEQVNVGNDSYCLIFGAKGLKLERRLREPRSLMNVRR